MDYLSLIHRKFLKPGKTSGLASSQGYASALPYLNLPPPPPHFSPLPRESEGMLDPRNVSIYLRDHPEAVREYLAENPDVSRRYLLEKLSENPNIVKEISNQETLRILRNTIEEKLSEVQNSTSITPGKVEDEENDRFGMLEYD
ncbi:hypothetical protein HYS49_00675 [Candidatus Woesearchaeota archaeon]|nr:hypothetical protein [Candidatus Woesearchaeota archaeon]